MSEVLAILEKRIDTHNYKMTVRKCHKKVVDAELVNGDIGRSESSLRRASRAIRSNQ